MLKLGAETEITWRLSSVSKSVAAKSNSVGLRCLYHTKITLLRRGFTPVTAFCLYRSFYGPQTHLPSERSDTNEKQKKQKKQ